jgi:hypothetical protein
MVTALALAALAAALLAPTAGAAESAFLQVGKETAAERLAAESTLRLGDMPPGYVRGGEEASCGLLRDPSENEDIYERREHLPPTPAEAFVAATRPGFCFIDYEQLYRVAGTGATPLSLASFALAAPSTKAAAEGLALGAEPFEYTLDVGDFTGAGPAPAIGEEARLFHTNRGRAGVLFNLPSTLLLWRQGATIGGVFATSMKATVSDAAAAGYAVRQQAHVATPRPYLAREADDTATYLGNPNIKVPIYWLGPAFEPRGLPAAYFERALGSKELVQPVPSRKLILEYSNFRILSSWAPSGWAKFSQTTLGRRQSTWRCTRSESIALPHGHALIYASYKKNYRTCPTAPPRHFFAHVFLPGAVITIGEAYAPHGQGEFFGYESWRGMKAIARALRPYRG